jgi:hypothetical protein
MRGSLFYLFRVLTFILCLVVPTASIAKIKTVSDFQKECERKYPEFIRMIKCIKRKAEDDIRYKIFPANRDALDYYVNYGKFLNDRIALGDINETEARIELSHMYIELKRNQDARNEFSRSFTNNLLQNYYKSRSYLPENQQIVIYGRTHNCTRYGNLITCN